jgi:pimeloyl-ACP methyl ester carboxylesterase
MLKRMITSVLVGAVLIYGSICAVLYLFQEKLIFLRQPLLPGTVELVHRLHPDAEEIRLPMVDGVVLHGWFKRGPVGARAPLLIYFGGNAEEMSWVVDDFSKHSELAVALINYRGYGLSQGAPSEIALTADALAIYDSLLTRQDVDPTRIILMGRSLGTGVAVFLASQRKARAVILVSPYDSLSAVAQSHYPAFPVAALLRHRFDSLSRAPNIDPQLLALSGVQDTLVTPGRSRSLVAVWRGPHQLEELDGAGHNDITVHPKFWATVNRFIDEVSAPKR